MTWRQPDVQKMRGLGFQINQGLSFVCPLEQGLDTVWNNMKGTCRTRIRKAERTGLRAELTCDRAIVSQFYAQFSSVMKRKKCAIPYPESEISELFDRLQPANRLFAIRVLLGDKVVATGFYPHDTEMMYYWDSAYNPDFLCLCPNELLHWTAIQTAITQKILHFEIGGAPQPSRFTRKFGGELIPYISVRKAFMPLVGVALNAYRGIRDRVYHLRGSLADLRPPADPGRSSLHVLRSRAISPAAEAVVAPSVEHDQNKATLKIG